MARIGLFPRLLMLVFVPILPSCGTLYLHSSPDQKAMDSAMTGMTAAKQSQLAALAEHRNVLQTLIAQERSAVTVENLRLRDSLVIQAMSGDWKKIASVSIQTQLDLLTGQSSLPTPLLATGGKARDARFSSFFEASELSRRQLPASQRRASRAEAIVVAEGGVIKKACSPSGESAEIEVALGNTKAAEAKEDAIQLCRQVENAWKGSMGAYEAASKQPPLIQCMLGVRQACEDGGASRAVPAFDALAAALDVDELIAANRELAKATRNHLAQLEKTYKCERAAEAAGGPGAGVSAAAKLVTDFVKALPNSSTAVNTAVAAQNPAPPKPAAEDFAPCPGGTTEALTFAGLLEKAGLKPEHLKKLLEGLAKIEPGDSVVAALGEARATFAQSSLAALLKATADPAATLEAGHNESTPTNRANIVAAGFVALLDPLGRLRAATSGTLPDTRAILVDLAMARYELSLAQIEIDRLTRSREAIHVRAGATIHQLASLDTASGNVQDGKREQTILALADAWNRGAIPAAAAAVELRGYRYVAWTAREEAATQTNYATIEPLLAELQAYAAGGFTAEEIARLLSAAGVIGIAVGVN